MSRLNVYQFCAVLSIKQDNIGKVNQYNRFWHSINTLVYIWSLVGENKGVVWGQKEGRSKRKNRYLFNLR